MGGAEHHVYALILPQNGPRLAEPGEKLPGQAKLICDVPVKFPGHGVHKAGGAGVGVLVCLSPAEPPHQVHGHHQPARGPLQPPRQLVGIELVDGVEGLELYACAGVQIPEGDYLMDLGDGLICAAVPIGVAGRNRLVPPHEHIVHPPGVHGQALYPRTSLKGRVYPRPDLPLKARQVPGEMAVLLGHTVFKAVDLRCAKLAVLLPAHYVTA